MRSYLNILKVGEEGATRGGRGLPQVLHVSLWSKNRT